ncbi:MAG: hypothetical protein ACI9UO_002614 [Nitrospinales bacterium]|jgi:hypothetical protein
MRVFNKKIKITDQGSRVTFLLGEDDLCQEINI